MKTLLLQTRAALAVTFVFAVLLCGVYPLAIWAIGQAVFADKANGSLIVDKSGTIRGSSLLGQNFSGEQYFHPRPSAAGASGYDAAGSGGSNLGPTSQKLADQIRDRVAAYRKANGLAADARIPADAVTASGSGLDPHISMANAELQAPRVARARNLTEDQVRGLISANTDDGTLFGVLGRPGVNVLKLNMALDGLL
ncbi:potassium-transporting ATPase subunit C [Verrucomicrobia bacterium LW23]|nr:potassium-transporting ATPase subunit C [Verrucomicrobia bacterium LW23]